MIRALFLLIFSVFTHYTFAQEEKSNTYLKLEERGDYTNGYIITKDHHRINGLIERLNDKLYRVISFVHYDGREIGYRPPDISEYGFNGHRYVSDGDGFYEMIMMGTKISLFIRENNETYLRYDAFNQPGTGIMGSHFNVIKNRSGVMIFVKKTDESEFKRVRLTDFKMNFIPYFQDCQIVVDAIEYDVLTYKDIEDICTLYNTCED